VKGEIAVRVLELHAGGVAHGDSKILRGVPPVKLLHQRRPWRDRRIVVVRCGGGNSGAVLGLAPTCEETTLVG
jgi:hypothetical protein